MFLAPCVNYNKFTLIFVFFSQNYINYIIGNPLLARHISVKKFLDPRNYSFDFQGEFAFCSTVQK